VVVWLSYVVLTVSLVVLEVVLVVACEELFVLGVVINVEVLTVGNKVVEVVEGAVVAMSDVVVVIGVDDADVDVGGVVVLIHVAMFPALLESVVV
jgi:hypothetical protein